MIKNGDLKVMAVRNGREDTYQVSSINEAYTLMNNMADADLKNDDIDFNSFSLLEYSSDANEWFYWRNDSYETMDEIISRGGTLEDVSNF